MSITVMEEYKLNILKLAPDGLNWVTHWDHMKYALNMCRWVDHLMSDTITQAYKDAGNVGGVKPEVHWKADEAIVWQMIVTFVPNSVFNHIKAGADVKAVWELLKKVFEGHTRNLLIDLGKKLQNTKCGEDEDELLANFHEQLASMGETISDEQYTNILMSSLPSSYDANISMITANANMSSTPIASNTVICILTNEWDKCALKKTKPKLTQDKAFATDTQKNNKKKNKKDIECFNYHKKGHMKSDCWAKGGDKEGQGPKKKAGVKDNATMAAEKLANNIKAWAVIEEVDDIGGL